MSATHPAPTLACARRSTKNWDFAFQKSARTGAVRTSFRLEIINVFDTPDFNGPVTGFGTRNFGKITSVLGFARTFQFTLRFDW